MSAKDYIMQMEPLFGTEEKKALCDYMDEGGFITEYKRTEKFENCIAKQTGAKHCIVVNNGTISLTIAALSLGLKPGDEVLVPNYTMIATPNSLKMIGVIPVFVDVEPETLCIDFEKLKSTLTPRTKAIMLVSANGRYPKADITEYESFADKNGLHIIEDAAQSLGSFYPDGRHIGSAGIIGSFSFSAPKIISTGQGGALITNNDLLNDRIRKLKDFGRSGGGNDVHDSIGFNFKFTELQACIGIEQFGKLHSRIKRKKEMWKRYEENLSSVPQIKLFGHCLDNTAPWFIDSIAECRDELKNYLHQNLIGTRVMYPPINKQKAYKIDGEFPVSQWVGDNGLWLPSSVQLTDEQIDYICCNIKNFYNERS